MCGCFIRQYKSRLEGRKGGGRGVKKKFYEI